jgi:hypothetical protein
MGSCSAKYIKKLRFTGPRNNIAIFGENNNIFLFKFKQTGVRSGQPVDQGGDLHVHGKVAALLHLRDHAGQASLRHQLCAGSAQRLANACQGFSGYWSGKKNRPQERENKMCFFFIKCIPENAYNYYVYIAFGDKLKVTKIFRSTEADRLFLKIRPQFHRRYDRLLYLAFF